MDHSLLQIGMEQVYLGNYLKTEEYWDKETVKLTEINYDVVKETPTTVNLYLTVKKIVLDFQENMQCNMLMTQIINEPETSVYLF